MNKTIINGLLLETSKNDPFIFDKTEVTTVLAYRKSILDHFNFYVKVTCQKCGKQVIKNMSRKKPEFCSERFLNFCRACNQKISNQEKYGVDNVFQLEAIKSKSKETCNRHYGTDNYMQSDKGKENFKNYSLNKYGTENPFQSEEIKQKIKQTNTEKYGVEIPLQNSELQEKRRQTCNKRYGVDFPLQTPEFKKKQEATILAKFGTLDINDLPEIIEKIKNTNRQKYGYDYSWQSPEISKKIENTNLIKYGSKSPFGSEEIRQKIIKTNLAKYGCEHPSSFRYKYDGYLFDSTWETAFYIFCKNLNLSIIREPYILYYSYNNKEYKYYPDFLVEDSLIEIKGDQFFDKDNNLVCPYKNKHVDNGKLKAKQKCMLENSVIVLRKTELKSILKYIKMKYGKNFLSTLKI